MMVLSSSQLFSTAAPEVSCFTPGLGLNVPGTVHLGYSSNNRAHSLRFTSKIVTMSMSADLTKYPGAVSAAGVICIKRRVSESDECKQRDVQQSQTT